jgi:DNA-binding transcriptional regulator YdaS (Cro superfamily)
MVELQEVFKKAGGQVKLARHFNVSRAAICQWRRVPAERCIEVSKLTGIALNELRPDIYPAK